MKPSNDREAVLLILQGMTAAGCQIDSVADDTWNPDELQFTSDPAEATEMVMAVDEATVYIKLPNGQKSWVFFVLGNDPEEVACDHGVNLSPYIDPIVTPWWN